MLDRSGLLFTAIAVVFCATAIADDRSDQAVVRGLGTSSCAEFGIAYKKNPKFADLMYGTWAQGFMSGINAQLLSDGKPARKIPAPNDGQDFQIRQLCDQRPLVPYLEVVWDYYDTLPELPPKTDHKRP
jgi:hypothetical protein